MRSALPKVLHRLAGKPLLHHVLDTASRLQPQNTVVVYGHGGERVRAETSDAAIQWVEQAEQLGTGHAVQQAMAAVAGVDKVLVLYGDVPLTDPSTLQRLLDEAQDTPLGVLTADLLDPTGYGRIVRGPNGRILRIVEHRDASEPELEINEINTGIMVFDRARLAAWLEGLGTDNAQGEYYLTDVIAMAVADGVQVASAQPRYEEEVLGVNDRAQLAHLERYHQRGRAEALMLEGVTLADPTRLDVRGKLQCARDVSIDVNCIFEGTVVLEEGVEIGPNCLLKDTRVGKNTKIAANSVLEDAQVGAETRIGPFARLRPGAVLNDKVHVGNFVEIKKSTVGIGSKVNHLSYVGDSTIGAAVNVGAGTITCNYDGANKFETHIGDGAFIGSNTALVAPVSVGDGATIAAGSVITRDAPAHELSIARGRQTTVKGWKRPAKQPKNN